MRHLLIIIATENREEGMICRMLFQNPRASNASAAQIKIWLKPVRRSYTDIQIGKNQPRQSKHLNLTPVKSSFSHPSHVIPLWMIAGEDTKA